MNTIYIGIWAAILIMLIFLVVLAVGNGKKLTTLGEKGTENLEKIVSEEIRSTRFELEKDIEQMRQDLNGEIKASRQETIQYLQNGLKAFADMIASGQRESAEFQDKRLAELNRTFESNAVQNEQKLENIRSTMEKRIAAMQEDNNQKLERMRQTVDEKLQKTLEERIGQSFKLVSDRLEQVYIGLGEMKTLASGVGDLKKVLSNVKTRGILGEIQLGAILEQILSKEQYEENISTKRSGGERVEFAIKLPGDEEGNVYRPIDAKFPADPYARLVEAYDNGTNADIDEAGKALERAIKKAAKDIHDKYVEPPFTTDFAILFLPFEGLYAEVVRRGLIEDLQRDYKINISGPTTMAALLNSLQMGFKTLAIQKRSSEVWNVLGAVKTEFDKFGNVLQATQQRITQANSELDKLIGVRTRTIQRKLRGVSSLTDIETNKLLALEEETVLDFEQIEEVE